LAGSSVGVMGRGISLAGVDVTINWLHIVRELLISSKRRCMSAVWIGVIFLCCLMQRLCAVCVVWASDWDGLRQNGDFKLNPRS
jgi:hypothetical protein